MDSKLKREIILENYQNPFNRGLKNDEGYIKVNTRNASCVDNIDLEIKITNNIIEDIRFDGEACAICTASTSMILKNVLNKSVEEAKILLDNYQKMIAEKEYDNEKIGELCVYDDIYKQPSRKKCALLTAEALDKVL